MKAKQLIKRLKAAGVEVSNRGKTSHKALAYRGKKSTLQFHGSQDLPKNYIRMVCTQLGLDPDKIL